MVILKQPVDIENVQTMSRSIAVLGVFIILFLIGMFMFHMLHPSGILYKKKKEVTFLTFINTFILCVVLLLVGIFLLFNSYRVITPLKVPVYEKSYSNTTFGKLFVQNANKPVFADKYRDNINDAIDDNLGKYHIPECELDKPKEDTSLLCGGYSLDAVSAIDKETNKNYTLTPELDYSHDYTRKSSTVQVSVKEEEGYRDNA